MTTFKRLIGLPVILDGRNIGTVLRAVAAKNGHQMQGLIIRCGVRGDRWLEKEQIRLLGNVSVIASGETKKPPREARFQLFRVSGFDGSRLGVVSDAVVDQENLTIPALEISSGPVDDLIEGRWFATRFHVSLSPSGKTGHITIPEEVKEHA